jgi:hypothetical protein
VRYSILYTVISLTFERKDPHSELGRREGVRNPVDCNSPAPASPCPELPSCHHYWPYYLYVGVVEEGVA